MIELFHVTLCYPGGQLALDDVSLRVRRGEFVFLTGASGAGKSTLLKLVYRALVPTSGQIVVNGRNVTSLPRRKVPYLRRSIGVVFQDFRLIGRRSVFDNVSYLPRILGIGAKQQRLLAEDALAEVGLADRLAAFPHQLSAGEQQRVAIARALVNRPEILVADEPTGNLDPDLSREIFRLFQRVNQRGTTVMVATHDRELVRELGERVLVLAQGRCMADAAPEGGA